MDTNKNVVRSEDCQAEIPDLRLVKLSVFLVVFCEILPLEADCTFMFFYTRDILAFVATKTVFLTLILLPLAICVKRNGWKSLKLVWGSVAFVVIVVSIRMVLDGFHFWSCLTRG